MQPEEKEKLLADLDTGRKALLDALSGVTEELAAQHPGDAKWSILECVEHLAISEAYLFSQIEARYASDVVIDPRREALITARGADRTRPIQSPEVGRPTGRFSTLANALQHFLATRERTIRFIENCTKDLRSKQASHPILKTATCHEMLLMIAVHPRRHASQIEQIKSAL